MYTCHLTVMRKEVFESAGGFRTGYEGAQDYDLLLRVMERTDRISHLPRILYHWRKLPRVDSERRIGEAVGDGCRAARARGLRRPSRAERGGAAGRRSRVCSG